MKQVFCHTECSSSHTKHQPYQSVQTSFSNRRQSRKMRTGILTSLALASNFCGDAKLCDDKLLFRPFVQLSNHKVAALAESLVSSLVPIQPREREKAEKEREREREREMKNRERSVSFRGTSREPQGLWASHTAQRTERARSTPFTPLFFSGPSLEPNPARPEASVHSSLDLKHFTAGEH